MGGLSAPSARSSAMPSFMRSAHPFHCPSPTAPASPSGTALAVKVAAGFCRCNKDSFKASLPTHSEVLLSIAQCCVAIRGSLGCEVAWWVLLVQTDRLLVSE